MKNFRNYLLIGLVGSSLIFTSCGDDDSPEEVNDPEVITNVNLVFTNTADATDVVRARAEDPDDLGVEELVVLDEITLTSGATYRLTYEIINNLATDPAERDVLAVDISNELDEHQIFYSFSTDAFTSPTGSGNIAPATGSINYEDEDGSGNPVGLVTSWTAGPALTGGTFIARLQHQPDGQKTATSTSATGDTDFELPFVLNIN